MAAPLSPRLTLWMANGEAQFWRWCWRVQPGARLARASAAESMFEVKGWRRLGWLSKVTTATLWGTLPMMDSSIGARGGAMELNLLNSRAPAPPISMATTRARGSPPVSCSSIRVWGMPSSVNVKSVALRVKTS